jgi:hypothetical protein
MRGTTIFAFSAFRIFKLMPFRYCLSLLLSLVTLLTISPESASADTVGTLQLDRNFIKTPDGVITVTLNDFDLNAPVLHENEPADADGNQYQQPASLAVGAILEVRVRNLSIHSGRPALERACLRRRFGRAL